MRNVTEAIEKPFVPEAILVAYRNKDGAYHLESHQVLLDGSVGAAKNVSRELMGDIAKTFSESFSDTPHGRIPKRLLYADTRSSDKVLVWWSAPERRTLLFDKKVPLPDGEYEMPGVVYLVKGQTLSVYAFKGKHPTSRTRLLMGPFFNYYEDCRMCLGSSRMNFPKEPTWDELLRCWENIFWNSVNVHLISNPVTGNIITHLKKAMKAPFDTSVCRKTRLTLGDIA